MTPNTSAEVITFWGDQEHVLFALKGRQIEHLEKSCNAHIAVIVQSIMTQVASYAMIRGVIAGGLEGGGMPPIDVVRNMARWFDGRPLADPRDPASPMATAIKIIGACWFGIDTIKSTVPPDDGKEPANTIDIPAIRAKLLEFGVDPRAVDTMSLYDIMAMFNKMEKAQIDQPMSNEKYDELKAQYAEMEAGGKIASPSGEAWL